MVPVRPMDMDSTELDDILDAAFELVRARNYAAARRLLESEARSRRDAGLASDAGHLSATLAVACYTEGDLRATKEAYRQAIADDPTNFFHREELARFLFDGDDPAAALIELDEARRYIPTDIPTVHHNFDGLRASIVLTLGRVDEAIGLFRKLNDPAFLARMDSRGIEVDIARRLCRAGIICDEVHAYLQLVLTRAEKSDDRSTVVRVMSLLAKCDRR